MRLKLLLHRLIPGGNSTRNVLTLITGTSLAQAIPLAISPILTRLYSPEEFGHLALYAAICMIASVFVTARYEQAIMLPHQDRDAFSIAVLACCISIIISFALLVIMFFAARPLALQLGDVNLEPWLYWVPASTLLIGINQTLAYWNTRKANFKNIAINRGIQGSSTSIIQLSLGLINEGSVGLISGQVAGQALSTGGYIKKTWSEDKKYYKTLSLHRLYVLAKRYVNFPRYMIVGHAANVLSSQAPLLLLGQLFSALYVGYYSLTQRVLAAPLSLIASAMGDVFLSESSKIYRERGEVKKIFINVCIKLFVIALIVNLPIFFFGEEIFSFIFGEKWRGAGEIASILSPMVIFQTIAAPTGQIVFFAHLQRFDFIWQMVRLITTISAFMIGYWMDESSIHLGIIFYAVTFCVLYTWHLVIQYKVAAGFYSEQTFKK